MADEDDDDPLERARAAIRAAREARGLDPDAPDEDELPPLDSDDPLERARQALDRAAAARASQGRKADEREQRAREELERLKAGGTTRAPVDPEADTEEDKAPRP